MGSIQKDELSKQLINITEKRKEMETKCFSASFSSESESSKKALLSELHVLKLLEQSTLNRLQALEPSN